MLLHVECAAVNDVGANASSCPPSSPVKLRLTPRRRSLLDGLRRSFTGSLDRLKSESLSERQRCALASGRGWTAVGTQKQATSQQGDNSSPALEDCFGTANTRTGQTHQKPIRAAFGNESIALVRAGMSVALVNIAANVILALAAVSSAGRVES